MPYPDRLYRCNLNAVTANGERIVNTVWMRRDTVNDATAQGVANRVRDSWSKAFTAPPAGVITLSGVFFGATRWTNVTVYKVNALGQSTEQAEAAFGAAVVGSAGAAVPPQVALVVTLLTGAPGRSARGRMFLGGLSTNGLTADGRLTTARRDDIVAAMTGFYKDLRQSTAVDDAIRPVVVSPTKTDARKITAIQVGDVFDTMRSRRGSLIEARGRGSVDE